MPKVVVVVAVVATKFVKCTCATLTSVALWSLIHSFPATAGVLPEERADVMYHSYNGGGMEITGPSVLVRKNFLEKISVSANYYIDNVSSASVDVESYASPYTEERTEQSLGVDFLNNKTTMSMGFTTSEESDYDAETAYFGVSQDFFGDLTTLSMGYSQGDDEVRRNEREPGSDEIVRSVVVGNVDRQNYRFNLSQVLTKNMVAGLGFETISDEGFLNNPYRAVRYLTDTGGFLLQPEQYPATRTSDAVAVRAIYYLPWRASLRGEYRFFTDTWGIDGSSIEFRYVHPWDDNWNFEFKLRQYEQTGADFYNDLFPRESAQNFLARDKELSTFSSLSYGLGATYTFTNFSFGPFEQFKLNLFIDHMEFEYDDFRDISGESGFVVGAEPLYSFSADVVRFFLAVTY